VTDITSTRNEHVKRLAQLLRAPGRREAGRHLVEGPHAVGEALAAGVVEEVLGTPDVLASLERDLPLPAGVRVTSVTDHVLARLTDTRTPQGLVAVARNVTSWLDEVLDARLVVVLHEVADPGNAGTILRTADAAGAGAVVLTVGSVDPFAPKAVRAAAGSTYHVPLVTQVATVDAIAALSDAGHLVVGLDGTAEASVFELAAGPAGLALVLGNEAHGLPAEVIAVLDGRVAVPIRGRAESLNVAAAAAVALYAAAGATDRTSD
jgi:RNA methyltransferase, TrmH family